MINAVSSFFPSSISQSPYYVRSSTDAQQLPAFQASQPVTSNQTNSSSGFSFADKLQQFFSLSPSDFSEAFGTLASAISGGALPQLASAAYTSSNLLTGKKLSLSA